MNEENRQRNKPQSVGSLNLNRGTLQGLLPIPADALESILQVLIADRLRYAVLDGTRLRYRHVTVRQFRLDRTYDEGDLPAEDE